MPIPALHDPFEDVVSVVHQGPGLGLELLLVAPPVLQCPSRLVDDLFLLRITKCRIQKPRRHFPNRFAEDRLQLSQRASSDLKAFVQPLVDALVDRVVVYQVEDRHLVARLPQPVDPPNALLETHRIPR